MPSALSDESIKVFESFLESKLPDAYRLYLLEHNGGAPRPNGFEIPGQGHSVIDHFFSLTNRSKTDELAYKIRLYKDRVPDGFLPIGGDPGGNLLLLGLRGSHRSAVFFWDHELEADDEPQPYFANIVRLADSFDAFIKSLRNLDAQ